MFLWGWTYTPPLPNGAAESDAGSVPERILGVEREVWECFSDRPGWEFYLASDDRLGGCGGWPGPTVRKVDLDTVRVSASGRSDPLYVEILEESLEELSPLLNLDFEWVDTQVEGHLNAFVGVPSGRGSLVFDCYDAAGCANDILHRGEDHPPRAHINVWLVRGDHNADQLRAEIKHVTIHELLHALVMMKHRADPFSMMYPGGSFRLARLSDSDEALLRLYAHPLVRDGMTMPEVRQLIVFADELLDPPGEAELDGYDIAERASAKLIEAGSARFHIEGGWGPRNCPRFSGSYSIGDLSTGSARLLHIIDEQQRGNFVVAHDGAWRYWRERRGEWVSTTSDAFFDATPIRSGFTNPFSMLISVLRYADDDISVMQAGPGSLQLEVTLDNARALPLPWASDVTIDVSITLDAETYEISGYAMDWRFTTSSGCDRYDVTATGGEYGADIPDPR